MATDEAIGTRSLNKQPIVDIFMGSPCLTRHFLNVSFFHFGNEKCIFQSKISKLSIKEVVAVLLLQSGVNLREGERAI